MQQNKLLELLYIKKDYSEINELLKNSSDIRSFNILGKINLWDGNIAEAFYFFNKAQNILGCCYCHLLNEKIEELKVLLNLVKYSSPAINWLIGLIDIIEEKEEIYPSYFQIRNFYEQDLELMFKYKKFNYIDKLIKRLSYLEFYNREIYKYTGRVLLNNNLIHQAENFLQKSLEIFYNDPETHFLYGEINLLKGDKESAIKEFTISNDVNSGYLPAINKLKSLSN